MFSLSLRDVELILAERASLQPTKAFASGGRNSVPLLSDALGAPRMHGMDEVFIRIGGMLQYLGRAVVQHGMVLDWCKSNAKELPPSASSSTCCKG